MRTKYTLTSLLCLLTWSIFAQNTYFQQDVHYKIKVSLDDTAHILRGVVNFEYQNNAPDALPFIYVLLQPNAYSNRKTAFAAQDLRNSETDFYFAKTEDLGYMKDLKFTANSQICEVEADSKNTDYVKVILPKPLKSGEKVTISTPFTVKVPRYFSRMGHFGQQYCITQWYPKPAVYDNKGWHPMPYLDLGEFYADFGTFDVEITLPENYVVGATGSLETASEKAFLAKKIADTEGYAQSGKFPEQTETPPSSATLKTIRYTAENVQDFAWFADKRYHVLKQDITLPSGKKTAGWAFFTSKDAKRWQKVPKYIAQTVSFLSETVGEYPHPHASVAECEGSSAMEYPMITLIGGMSSSEMLDIVTAHEVGHNWFQGMLGSNERDFAWLDEGINSYYEQRYTRKYYPQGSNQGLPSFLFKHTDYDLNALAIQALSHERKAQSPSTTALDFEKTNYGVQSYYKPAAAFYLLENYLGTDKFDKVMQKYFAAWRFKHPYPEDLRRLFEAETGENLAWIFEGLLNSDKLIDFSAKKIEKQGDTWLLHITNPKNSVAVPFEVGGYKNGQLIEKQWFKGFVGDNTVSLKGDFDEIIIDPRNLTLDCNRKNNTIKTSGVFKKIEPLDFNWIMGLDNSRRTNIYGMPVVAFNTYDKLQAGFLFQNGILPVQNKAWHVAPMFGIGSKTLTGVANFEQSVFLGKNKLTFGLNARRFNFDENTRFDKLLAYSKLTPSVSLEFAKKATNPYTTVLQFRHILLGIEDVNTVYDTVKKEAVFLNKAVNWQNISELSLSIRQKSALGNGFLRVAFENQDYTDFFGKKNGYTRGTLEIRKSFKYAEHKAFMVRGFLGGFLRNGSRESSNVLNDGARGSLSLNGQAANDYRFDNFFFGRNSANTWGNQIDPNTEGGMHFALRPDVRARLGLSNAYVAALNLKSDLPVLSANNLSLRPYFDLGYFKDMRTSATRADQNLLATGGVALELFDGAIGFYVPVWANGSKDNPESLKNLFINNQKFGERIMFTIDLKQANVRKIIRSALF